MSCRESFFNELTAVSMFFCFSFSALLLEISEVLELVDSVFLLLLLPQPTKNNPLNKLKIITFSLLYLTLIYSIIQYSKSSQINHQTQKYDL